MKYVYKYTFEKKRIYLTIIPIIDIKESTSNILANSLCLPTIFHLAQIISLTLNLTVKLSIKVFEEVTH